MTYLGHDYIDRCLYIYMEYMIGGSMAGVLQQFGAFEEGLSAKYTKELLQGLAYLHTQEPPVLHRDIKSATERHRAMCVRDVRPMCSWGRARTVRTLG